MKFRRLVAILATLMILATYVIAAMATDGTPANQTKKWGVWEMSIVPETNRVIGYIFKPDQRTQCWVNWDIYKKESVSFWAEDYDRSLRRQYRQGANVWQEQGKFETEEIRMLGQSTEVDPGRIVTDWKDLGNTEREELFYLHCMDATRQLPQDVRQYVNAYYHLNQ